MSKTELIKTSFSHYSVFLCPTYPSFVSMSPLEIEVNQNEIGSIVGTKLNPSPTLFEILQGQTVLVTCVCITLFVYNF